MKKRSFFERLAGNLRFNEDEADETEQSAAPQLIKQLQPERRMPQPMPIRSEQQSVAPAPMPEQRRELPITGAFKSHDEEEPTASLHVHDEEVGQLPVDVYETAKEVIIQTLIAGVMPENLTINITRDVVSISGKREENKSISQDSYHVQELYWGAFERVVDLPMEVEIDNAEAIERHGLLMIKLPKLDKERKAALKIKSI